MERDTVGILDRFRQPEYTGENRCVPCTIVNAVIAIVLAGVVGVFAASTWDSVIGAGVGGLILIVSALSIALRGYLIPGTPTLTKRYFPDWLLAKFDKEVEAEPIDVTDEPFDPEQDLLDAGVLEPCADEDDLCLVDGLRERWRAHVADVREADRRETVAAFIERDPTEVEIDESDDGEVVTVRIEDANAARWESEAALLADLAGERLLAEEIPGWGERPLHQRGQLVGGFRAFLEYCPSCDGKISLDSDTVESCCRSYEVYAVTCEGCEARLLEITA